MNITNAKYTIDNETNQKTYVKATIDGDVMFVPMVSDNRHYQAILEWVEDGNTIEEAD